MVKLKYTEYTRVYIIIEVLTIALMWCVGIEFASIIMIVYLKTVFVASAVFLFSCCDGETAIQSEHIKMNERPIIGILSQEQDYRLKDKYSQENFMSYISASYVKSVEASGARVLPIFIGKSRNYYKELMSKINGVLYPGGNTWFNQSDGYADAGQHIYEIAQEFNDAGDYFPLFGTCLGFELFVIMASGKDRPENRVHCVAIGNYPLMFTEDYRSSKLFNQISKKSADLLEKENSTVHHHQFCIVDENLERYNLTKDWRVSSHSMDNQGKKFISSIEHRRYPFYGVQFHPEKPAFEWNKKNKYLRSRDAIDAQRYFMDFFVEECKRNSHKFIDEKEETDSLIYNYKPYYTGAQGAYFTQCYFFEPQMGH
ncbi:unnamed protein product [Chilo suppressalis]|uniref:folate gamma-glutamyl hydrolase n=1 Tax=Chilo suppressalis TaxID=168631 RepID=A0ABN8ASF9_CHISP|nr:unnamed protein product [Chilo suppressalis]